jgi:hypothetical protein
MTFLQMTMAKRNTEPAKNSSGRTAAFSYDDATSDKTKARTGMVTGTCWVSAACAALTIVVACNDANPTETKAGASPNGGPSQVATTAVEPHARELAALRAVEDERRRTIDFSTLPSSDDVLGANPYRVAHTDDGTRVGLLRGDDAVVVIDGAGAESERESAPRSASGLAVRGDGAVLVVGEDARSVARYRVVRGHLKPLGALPVDALGMRDVAWAPDGRRAYIVEDHDGRLLELTVGDDTDHATPTPRVRELGRCRGPIRVEAVADYVVTDCLLDHVLEIRHDGDDSGTVMRIRHDGPLWGFALTLEPAGGLLIAAGGIEDHPLVRDDSGFGYIDSFLFLYRIQPGASEARRLAAVNTSALGVVTPKWLALRLGGSSDIDVTVAGYGSPGLLTLQWRHGATDIAPGSSMSELPPGTAAAELGSDGSLIAANPLLDAWVIAHDGRWQMVPITSKHASRSMLSRVGELLFFTTMMAPWNSSDGPLSRFTCEACHFEGYVDGRVHYTGRHSDGDEVHATTRPLLGVFNNRPHFSRALDLTTTQMVNNEFRVANRHNGHDPWFALARADLPWLAALDAPPQMPAEFLRRALMAFLVDFTPRTNPAVVVRDKLTAVERAGAVTFRGRCAGCHAARLVADDPSSEVPFSDWERLVLSASGAIVWSNGERRKTGVVPYVHTDGARVPSLRRLYKKWPYFTNGSARTLDDVLERFAGDATATFHDNAPKNGGPTGLSRRDQAALREFLELL